MPEVTDVSSCVRKHFVPFLQATPSADTAMFYFYTNSLGFDAEFMGRVRLLGSLASLAGVGTYNFLLKVSKALWLILEFNAARRTSTSALDPSQTPVERSVTLRYLISVLPHVHKASFCPCFDHLLR